MNAVNGRDRCSSMAVWKNPDVISILLTGIAFYTGINDFYQPLRDFLHPLYAFLRLFTPLYKSLFAKQQYKSAIILIWFWRYHAQDHIIEAYFQ